MHTVHSAAASLRAETHMEYSKALVTPVRPVLYTEFFLNRRAPASLWESAVLALH
jgi:hypothetical protein